MRRLGEEKPHKLLNPKDFPTFFPQTEGICNLKLTLFQDEPTFNMSKPMSGVISLTKHGDVAKMSPSWLLDPYTSPAPVTTSTFLQGDWENPLNYVFTDHF